MGKKSKGAGKKKGGAKKQNGSVAPPKNNRRDEENAPPAVADDSMSLYELYKVATHRFKNGLMALVPSNIFERDVVADLLDAADWIRDHSVAVEPQLIADLKLAINVRKRYSRNFVDGGDEGHGYFVLVLNYCLSVLKVSCPQDDSKQSKKEQGSNDEMTNMFAALAMCDESDDESEEEEDEEIKRPEEPTTHYSLTQYLYSIPDTAQANQFLDAISYHTLRAISLFQNLKETMQMVDRGELDESRVPCELVGAGVMLNMAIANVKHLEDSLAVECPHLNSPYRILACAYMAPPVNLIRDTVRNHSPVARNFEDAMALGFVSDIIKVVFRGQANVNLVVSKIADRFSRRWKLPEHWTQKVKWLGQIIWRMALKESLTEMERPYLEKYVSLEELGQGALNEQSWFEGKEACIGGDRSIMNTLKILDIFASSVFEQDSKDHILNLIPWRLDTWEEDTNPANKIQGDFDGNIMRIFMALMDSWRFDKRPVPREEELLPFVSLFRSWTSLRMKHETPLSVAFAFHLLLTSLYEMQGQGDVQRLATASVSTFNKFLGQVQAELDSSVPTPNKRKIFLTEKIMGIKKLTEGEPTVLEEPEDSLMIFWNPLCASMFLSYITFGSSLEGGGSSIDDGKQATFVLHLFNALRQRDLVDADLPVVSTIDEYFQKLKPIWNSWAARPEPKKFVYRFYLSMGADHSYASYRQELARYRELGGDGEKPEKPKGSLSEMLYKSRNRSSNCINPLDFSTSYKRICLNDFAGSENEWLPAHLQRDSRRHLPADLREHEIRVFRALTPVMNENDLFHLNLIVIGGLFNEFICHLFPPLGTDGLSMPVNLETIWKELYSQALPLPKNSSFYDDEDNARVIYTIQLLEYVLGRLDYTDAEEYEYMGRHFEKFFRSLDPDKVKILSGTR